MITHPVQFRVEPSGRMERVHVLIRLVLLLALGALGCSSLYWVVYLAVPAVVALLISSKGSERYLAEDAPRIARALRWLARAYAYLWLLTDAPPSRAAAVELHIEIGGAPTPGSALLRLLYSLPALVLLALLSFVAWIFWVIGAVAILLQRRVPEPIAGLLALVLGYQFRLLAYHVSLVERYPSFEGAALTRVPQSGAA